MTEQPTLSRRRLLGAGAVVGAGALVGAAPAAASATASTTQAKAARAKTTPFSNITGKALLPPKRIGLMLYTVRDQIESLGFARVFETIAGMGYNAVEFAGYSQGTGPVAPKKLRRLLDANGLTPVGAHGNLDDAAIAAAVDLNMPYTGIAFEIPSGTDTAAWERLAADYNAFGRRAAKHGVIGYLHPHGPAFAPVSDNPDKRGLDILLEQTDPKVFAFEMDIFWAYYFTNVFPGYDPIDWIRSHRSRFPLFHAKDGIHSLGDKVANLPRDTGAVDHRDVGQGTIPFEKFFSALRRRKRSWYLNERDNAAEHPQGSFCSAQASYLFMRHGLRR
ncbi:MAG TPA: sugar phosphate isomerase/epimerase [Egibacteraceae bacterium]|nr:sugar phosphate isomerase/epimerase [Egibacteraceae bacterium]